MPPIWLNEPRRVRITLTPEGVPGSVDDARVAGVREDWMIEERWWASPPIRRRYFELLLEGGSTVVVFQDLEANDWFKQRA